MKSESNRKVLLIVPSRIMVRGIEGVFSDLGEFKVEGILSDISRTSEARLKNIDADIIIIDPVVFDYATRQSGRSKISEYSDAAVVALQTVTMEDDFFFCEVMNGNRCLASLILNTFLPFPVSDVRSVVTQSTHGWKDKKGVRYDCLVRDGEGNIYEIEMQRRSEPYLNERMWYYISRMTGSIVKKGDGYSKLRGRKVASLFLLTTDVFKRGEAVYTYSVRDDDTYTPL